MFHRFISYMRRAWVILNTLTNEVRKITKCDKDSKVLYCKVTNRATDPKPAMYGDNGDVIGVSYIELFWVMWLKLL